MKSPSVRVTGRCGYIQFLVATKDSGNLCRTSYNQFFYTSIQIQSGKAWITWWRKKILPLCISKQHACWLYYAVARGTNLRKPLHITYETRMKVGFRGKNWNPNYVGLNWVGLEIRKLKGDKFEESYENKINVGKLKQKRIEKNFWDFFKKI